MTISPRTQFLSAKALAEKSRLDELTRKLNGLSNKKTLGKIDLTSTLRETWETASLEWKRNLIEMLIEKVVVYPREKHFKRVVYKNRSYFDPALIEIIWVC